MDRIQLRLATAIFFFASCPAAISSNSPPKLVSIGDVLNFARQNGSEFKAIQYEFEALELDIESREKVLSPTISSSISRSWDRRESLTSASATRQQSTLSSLAVEKPFSTGTTVGALLGYEWAQSPRTTPNRNTLIDWEVFLSQSLWRNGFGRETKARRAGDSWERRERRFANLLEAQNYLVAIETYYWSWVFAEKEKNIRRANLERSQRIESWVARRLRLSAAETSDLLQARSLVETRKLQMKNVENRIRSVMAQFESSLPGLDIRSLTPNLQEFSEARKLESLVVNEGVNSRITSLGSIIQSAKAARLESRAEQASSASDPDLEPSLRHGRNGIDGSEARARSEAFSAKNRYSEVALTLSSSLDFSLMRASARAAKLQAEADAIRASRLKSESEINWQDLERESLALSDQIQTARGLARIQQQKADAERTRFEKGRSTAFQAITFEQEAAEAELRVWELELNLRKLEAKARVYGRFEGAL